MTELVIKDFPQDDIPWTVIEYRHVSWNEQLPDEPLIEVVLTNKVQKKTKIVKIAKSYTLYATKGTIWLKGERIGVRSDAVETEFRFDTLEYSKSITPWEPIISSVSETPKLFYIPPYSYYIPKELRDCRFHVFYAKDGTEVIVSSITLFDGLFGHSMKAKQIVFNYSAEDSMKLMEFTDFDVEDYQEQPTEDEVVIGLAKDIRDNDRYFLYHLKTAINAAHAVNKIYRQLSENRSKKSYIEVQPWFNQDHYWKVQGVWLSERKRFFVLQILNFQYPSSPNFFVVRENHNIAAEEHKEEEKPRPGKKKNTNTKPTAASKTRPGSNSIPTDIKMSGEDELWGSTELRKAIPKENKTKKLTLPPKESDLGNVSPSGMNKSNSTAGKANLTRNPEEDNKTSERPKTMPNAVTLIQRALTILSNTLSTNEIEYLNKNGEWVSAIDAGLSELYELPGRQRWGVNRTNVLMNINGKQIYSPRVLGVFHMSINGSSYFFVAIERIKKESFRTAIFDMGCKEEFVNSLGAIAMVLEIHKGVWKKVFDSDYSLDRVITHSGNAKSIASQIRMKLKLSDSSS
ncbi:hypothetical protein SAMN06297229_0256 [Pseudidiomarina planktonica]|uniref:TnsE C-terminal domain-containing protein n=1 Tax=Pseudidiomarina planktonica TaxID=1323738 RepID=A0A1Y6EGV7_9GAMM|nr:hypothetical protein [Pseudidiomarina planktonica]RUO66252.1 hypothetical protein CWI77_07475 [Pseudidiomarina planktonica]SMQ59373.1 hypothetical protein SAMN06297229_0256 [Pseudidiomarina planktonica]